MKKKLAILSFLVVVGLLYGPRLFTAAATYAGIPIAGAWTVSYEATPPGSAFISEGDDRIRELKDMIRKRAEVEHLWGSTAASDTGRHQEGSARVYYQADCTTASLPVADTAGATALGAADDGRLCRDSDAGNEILNIWNGSAFVQAIQSFAGTLTFGTASWLCKVGVVNCFDPHEHGARHRDMTTAAGAGEDYMQWTIGSVVQDVTLDSATPGNQAAFACAGGTAATTIANVTLNTTGRRAGNFRALILASGAFSETGDTGVEFGLCDDTGGGAANLGGVTSHHRVVGESGNATNTEPGWAIQYLWTNGTMASHTVTLKAVDLTGAPFGGGDSTHTSVSLVVIDLGVDTP